MKNKNIGAGCNKVYVKLANKYGCDTPDGRSGGHNTFDKASKGNASGDKHSTNQGKIAGVQFEKKLAKKLRIPVTKLRERTIRGAGLYNEVMREDRKCPNEGKISKHDSRGKPPEYESKDEKKELKKILRNKDENKVYKEARDNFIENKYIDDEIEKEELAKNAGIEAVRKFRDQKINSSSLSVCNVENSDPKNVNRVDV